MVSPKTLFSLSTNDTAQHLRVLGCACLHSNGSFCRHRYANNRAADYVFIVVTLLPMIMVMILYMGVVNIWRFSVWSNWA